MRERSPSQVRWTLALALVMLAAVPAAAFGARGMIMGFASPDYSTKTSEGRRIEAQEARESGAGMIRIPVSWGTISNRGVPTDPRNPCDPMYSFLTLDDEIRAAYSKGLVPLLTIFGAPRYAEGDNRPSLHQAPVGTWKPKPSALGDFAFAVARRYSGQATPCTSLPTTTVPKVRYWQAWNEPNLSNYLTPQRTGRKEKSPGLYRSMLRSFYQNVNQVAAKNTVISAGTAPRGESKGNSRIRPLEFWRKTFCLNDRYKAAKGCQQPALMDAIAHHPINIEGGPRESARHRDDVLLPDLDKIVRVVRAAERVGHVAPAGKRPMWVTEFWWESDPPSNKGFPLAKQANYIQEALYLMWKQEAVASIYLQVRDGIARGTKRALGAGVLFKDGRSKVSRKAYRFPFVTHRTSRRKIKAWGRAPATGRLEIQRLVKGSSGLPVDVMGGNWKTLKGIDVSAGEFYLQTVKVRGKAKLRAKMGIDVSLTWRQGARG